MKGSNFNANLSALNAKKQVTQKPNNTTQANGNLSFGISENYKARVAKHIIEGASSEAAAEEFKSAATLGLYQSPKLERIKLKMAEDLMRLHPVKNESKRHPRIKPEDLDENPVGGIAREVLKKIPAAAPPLTPFALIYAPEIKGQAVENIGWKVYEKLGGQKYEPTEAEKQKQKEDEAEYAEMINNLNWG